MNKQWVFIDEPSKETQAMLLLERGTLAFPAHYYSWDVNNWPDGLIVQGVSGAWYRWNA